MCDFFSFITDGNGKIFAITTQQQKEEFYAKLGLSSDINSHSNICAFFDMKYDACNKYELRFEMEDFYIDTQSVKDETGFLFWKRLKIRDDSRVAKINIANLFLKMKRTELKSFFEMYNKDLNVSNARKFLKSLVE